MKYQKAILGILSLTLSINFLLFPVIKNIDTSLKTVAEETEEPLNPGIEYRNCIDHIEITRYDGRLTDNFGAHLIIPDTIEGLPVTKICPAACNNLSSLFEVWLPIDLEEIGDNAFAGCKNLTRIHFGLTLQTIGKRAFYNCGYMGALTLPETVNEIGDEAFAGCNRLQYVILPGSLRTIQYKVFSDTGIVSLCLPSSVERIENEAFSGCESLTNICYKGSSDMWAVLSIGSGNDSLYRAELLCDYNKQKVKRSILFDPKKDTWGFLNKDVEYYVLSEESLSEVTSNMMQLHKNQTNQFWKMNKEVGYQGACLGMALTSMLASAGIIDPSELDPNAQCLNDVKLTDKVRELISTYYVLQGNDSFVDVDIWSDNKRDYYLKQGIPILFWYQCYYYSDEKKRMVEYGHAVVAYGVEEGRYEFDGNVFTKKILTYDNNVSQENGRDGNIYLEPESALWKEDVLYPDQKIYIPYMKEKNEDLKLMYIPPAYNLDLLNLHGINKGIAYVEPEHKCALLRTSAMPNTYRMQCYVKESPHKKTDATYIQLKAGDYQALQCADGNKGYVLEMKNQQTLDCSMSYEKWLYTVKGSDLTSASFEPDGSITVSGSDSSYHLAMITDAEQHPTCFNELQVSGDHVDQINVHQTESGYVIYGTNLHEVTVNALNENIEHSISFSTDANCVLVHDINNNTLAVSADADNDGTYETLIATDVVFELGDVNNDGAIDATDATLLLIESVDSGAGQASTFNQAQIKAADVDQNGQIDATDATLILQYAVLTATGSELTLKEYIHQTV